MLAERYELVEAVGRGGMGEVWRATDRELGRTVAVKVLPPDLTRHEEFRVRFRREARTVASLNHRNVAVLHDVGEDTTDGETTPFLVMEFIEGRTLTDALTEGPFTVERALAVGRDIADALAHSHGQGLIHRDIKPSNVMLTSGGDIKVLDFGIAKVVAETTTRLTATGMTVGTPAYLSPEQLTGRPVDGRSDQYSSGCLLYELLTGRPPFVGDSPFAVMHQHISQEPLVPSRLRPQIPAAVDALVLRTLAKDREERLGSAAELREALAQTLAALSAPVTAPARQAAAPVPAAPPAPPAPTVPPARTSAGPQAGPGHTTLARQETRTAPTPPRPVGPPPGEPPGPDASDGGSPPDPGASSRTRRFPLGTGRLVALLGLAASGVVTIGYQDLYDDSLAPLIGVWVATAVLGLALFRWFPLTSTCLWWGAGALAVASVTAGGAAPDSGYSSEYGSLYYYDSYSSEYYGASPDGFDRVEIFAAPLLALAVLCLVRALRPRTPSPLAAACALTLGGTGVGWLAFDDEGQTGVFSVAWGLVVIMAVLLEIRARRNTPPRARRRLRFVAE
ncbi:serine/threonine-protein kinase [Streptomyces griseoruber]|uniref:serine/threonine-protein kinase n=1 Tax=Streptomyces griseoruber TaxID=1943 RepID=UPI0037B72866